MSEHSKMIDTRLSAHDQAVRLMAAWISAIADQVKNPVAGISAAANLIEKQMTAFRSAQEWDPAIVEEAVRLMLERLSRFDNYLTELSGFTREVELNSKWLDFSAEWKGLEQSMVRRIPLSFRINAQIAGSGRVYADPERLKVALIAIVLNSTEACGSDINPEILISVSPFKDQANCVSHGVLIRVVDNGPGFSDAALLQASAPFFTTKDAGTGLGLAMVEKYVRAHGGWIKIANRTQFENVQGAVVELFFPSPSL